MTPAEMIKLGRKQTEAFEEVTEQISDLTYALAEESSARDALEKAKGIYAQIDATTRYLIAQQKVRDLMPKPTATEYVSLYDGEELGYETDAPRQSSIYSEDEAADLRQRLRDLKGL
jgi:hypothetical protein